MIGELLILILLWLFDSTIRHYISLLCKLLSDDQKPAPLPPQLTKKNLQQNDLNGLSPEFFEFEAIEDVVNGEEDAIFKRKAIQKAICILKEGGDVQEDVKKWQFICKVCNKAFESVNLCEAHILKNEHTFLSSDSTQSEDFDMLRLRLETLRRMNGENTGEEKEKTINGIEPYKPGGYHNRQVSQDFIPIYFGNWSKVICELRHRFGQTCHGDYKNLNAFNIAELSLLKDQTFPKTIQKVLQEANQAGTIQNECPLRNPCPGNLVTIIENPKETQEPAERGDRVNKDHRPDSKDSRTSTETELSEITLPSDTDQPKEQAATEIASRASSTSSETANCQMEKVKVCVDFVTRLLYCESCYTTFRTIEQAFTHFKTDGDSDKSADQYTWDEYDVMHQSNQVLGDKGPGDCDIQMAGTNHDAQDADDKIIENFFEQEGAPEEDQTPSENPPIEFTDTLKSASKLDSENQNDDISQDSYSEKMPLFESHADGKQKRKKKKKKKAWRMVKRSVIYAIIFLF